MNVKEKIVTVIDQLPERELEKVLNILELQQKGIDIFMMHKGRPVINEEELSKLDLMPYFHDNWEQ